MQKKIKDILEQKLTLAELTSFKVGGKADYAAFPRNIEEIQRLLQWAKDEEIPITILGSASNVLVSDAGVEGLVIFSTKLSSMACSQLSEHTWRVSAGAGVLISDVSASAAERSLSGLAFIYSMPGTAAAAVWMNARCYGAEVADILEAVDYVDMDTQEVHRYQAQARDFDYKVSPFQNKKRFILSCHFLLGRGNKQELLTRMYAHEADRRAKGHFAAPCAGSIFKNNRAFGAPSGTLIDSLKLRGLSCGGAKISEKHANIIINAGSASAQNISDLMDEVRERVLNELGFDLEAEVLKIGRWSD